MTVLGLWNGDLVNEGIGELVVRPTHPRNLQSDEGGQFPNSYKFDYEIPNPIHISTFCF